MRLTNITRAFEVPTASKVRTEDFYSLPGEKSYFATRNTHVACEYSLFSPLLAAWNVSPASQAVRSVQASSPIWASEASRARTRERSSEAARGQRNPSPPRPAFASPLTCLSRVHFSWSPPNWELARKLRGARRNTMFSLARAYKHRQHV